MPIASITDIIKPLDPLKVTDLSGASFKDWEDYGVIGFDEGMCSYFLQLEGRWWVGSEGEVKSIKILAPIICAIFSGQAIDLDLSSVARMNSMEEEGNVILNSEINRKLATFVPPEYLSSARKAGEEMEM